VEAEQAEVAVIVSNADSNSQCSGSCDLWSVVLAVALVAKAVVCGGTMIAVVCDCDRDDSNSILAVLAVHY